MISPSFASDADSFLDDLCSILSGDVPVLSETATGAMEENGQYGMTSKTQAQLLVQSAATGVFNLGVTSNTQ